MILFIIVVALIPGLFWLFYFAGKDRYEPEPPLFLIYAFIAGMIAILPADVTEFLFKKIILNRYIFYIVVVGLSEEFFKYLSVRLTIYTNREFNEPIDGIVYSTAAALGFATVENMLYMFTMGWKVIFIRSILTTLGHVVFSALWGYPLYKTKMTGKKHYVVTGILLAALFHGLYDIFISSKYLISIFIAIAIVVILYFIMNREMKEMEKESPFRNDA